MNTLAKFFGIFLLKVIGFLADGKKIEAIKYVRETTGLGLKEAKDKVDTIIDCIADMQSVLPYEVKTLDANAIFKTIRDSGVSIGDTMEALNDLLKGSGIRILSAVSEGFVCLFNGEDTEF